MDTRSPDPMIYPPGSAPDKPLWIPLEGFTLSCNETPVEVTTRAGTVSFMLESKRWSGSAPFGKTVVAMLQPEATAHLADAARYGSFDALEAGLKAVADGKVCQLALADKADTMRATTEARAANIIQSGLPRKYSSMLRSAYNHRIWPQDVDTNTVGISVDLFPGMRLRIENSVPISPDGAGVMGGHPSSFAAPTYLYFHALTGAELCDPGSSFNNSPNSSYTCLPMHEERRDERIYLSPNGGLARLGLMQRDPGIVALWNLNKTSANRLSCGDNCSLVAVDASGLIDLQERIDSGEGAQRYWRLWLPVHRTTLPSRPVWAGGGSEESTDSTPRLFSAGRVEQLPWGELASSEPCAIATGSSVPWTCYSLRYRVVPIPEISIWVNGTRQWVTIGTTLLDVVAERLHDGFAGRSNHFSASVQGHDELADDMPRAASGLERMVASAVSVVRLHRDGPHPITAQNLAKSTDVARFLRLQLLPGDEIKWTK